MLEYSINRDVTEIVLIMSFFLTAISVLYVVVSYNKTHFKRKITELNEYTHEYDDKHNITKDDDEHNITKDDDEILNTPIKRNVMFLIIAIIPLITSFASYQVYKSNNNNVSTDLQNLTFTVEDKRISHYSNEGIVYEIETIEDIGKIKLYYTTKDKDDVISDIKKGDSFVLLENERINDNINSDKKIMLSDLNNYRWDIQEEYIK